MDGNATVGFFVNYGFSLEHNRDNEALMQFTLHPNYKQYDLKVRMLGGDANKNTVSVARSFQIPKMYSEKKVKECFSFLRFMHAAGPEIMLLSSSDQFRIDDIEPLSKQNEKFALMSLLGSAKKALSLFDTALDYDNKLLADLENYPMFSNERNTILMRRGEKEVLHHFIKLSQTCIQLLDLPWKDLKQQTQRKYSNKDDLVAQYINSVIVPLCKVKGPTW